jgi:transposase
MFLTCDLRQSRESGQRCLGVRRFPRPTYLNGFCVHARRKYVEVTEIMTEPGRAHEAIRFIKKLYRIERQIRMLNDAERHEQRQLRSVQVLNAFKAWLDVQINAVLPKSALGGAILHTLKNWDALCRYT